MDQETPLTKKMSSRVRDYLLEHGFYSDQAAADLDLFDWENEGRKSLGQEKTDFIFSLLFKEVFSRPHERAIVFLDNRKQNAWDAPYDVQLFSEPYCFLYQKAERLFRNASVTLQERFYENTKIENVDHTHDLLCLLTVLVLCRDYDSDVVPSVAQGEEGYTFLFPSSFPVADPSFTLLDDPFRRFLFDSLKRFHIAEATEIPTDSNFKKYFRTQGENFFSFFLPTAPERMGDVSLTSLERSIVNYVFKKKSATKKELAAFFVFSERTMAIYLQKLVEKGFLERTGSLHSPQQSYIIGPKLR